MADSFDDFARVTVSQYTSRIKGLLEGGIRPCWVLGEISNLRAQSSGHLYFSLKDAGAQLPVVMFRNQVRGLDFRPADGMEVLAFGEISVYEPHGRYQLIVRELRESGQGRLFREFARLKQKLLDEGLFASARKRALPPLPLNVAMVTSPTGAALQDFVRILKRRHWGGRLVVIPARVQGRGSAEEIVEGIRLANRLGELDLLVVGRGGGSIEDLWCFNEEMVARAIAASALPVLSAVGHETDVTLSDFAADARAETPSAAAEIISSAFLASLDRLAAARQELEDAAERGASEARSRLEAPRGAMRMLSPVARLERELLRLDELEGRFTMAYQKTTHERRRRLAEAERRFGRVDARRILEERAAHLRDLRARLETVVDQTLGQSRRGLDLAGATLRAIGPEATLRRGFVLLREEDGMPLTSAGQARIGHPVRAVLKDGELRLAVEQVTLSTPPERS